MFMERRFISSSNEVYRNAGSVSMILRSYHAQCPCCQVMSRLKILIRTHPFTRASYNPFESLQIDHIGSLPADDKGHTHILGRVIPYQNYGRFRGCRVHIPALRSILNTRCHTHWSGSSLPQRTLLRSNIPSPQRANQEVMHHLRAMLFDARVHDKWSYEQLPLVQRIMNTVEKTSTGVTPAELLLNNSICLSNSYLVSVVHSIDFVSVVDYLYT